LGMMLLFFFVAGRTDSPAAIYLLGAVLVIIPAMMLTNAARKKVVISDYNIRSTDMFTTSEMAISDVKGYRILNNKSTKSLVFESASGGGKLTISNATGLNDSEELLDWVSNNFIELDAIDIQNQKDDLLQNSMYGATPEEREASLKKAKTITIVYAVGAAVVGFFSIFYDNKVWAVLEVVYPFVGVVLILTSKGLIKFLTNTKRSIYPGTFFGLLIISMVCFFKGILNGDIYDAHNIWEPAIVFAIALAAATVFAGKDRSMPLVAQLLLALLISALCGFGNTLHINKAFDRSQEQTYHVVVVSKHISHGKSTSYYLHTAPWGPENKSVSPSVGNRTYNNIQVGDTITIRFRTGALNIPWYKIER